MSSKGKKSPPPAPGKSKAAASGKTSPAPQSTSMLGLVGAVIAALAIAAVLLFVINQRQGGQGTTTPPGTSARVSQGGFVKGNASAKVVVDEYGDFQ